MGDFILTDIRGAITTRMIGSANTLRTSILQLSFYKFFYHQALEQVPGTNTAITFPYVVWDILPASQTIDTVNKFMETIMQFRVSSLDLNECENIMGYISDLLEDSRDNITLTNYGLLRITRFPTIPPTKLDTVWNGIVQYRINLQET